MRSPFNLDEMKQVSSAKAGEDAAARQVPDAQVIVKDSDKLNELIRDHLRPMRTSEHLLAVTRTIISDPDEPVSSLSELINYSREAEERFYKAQSSYDLLNEIVQFNLKRNPDGFARALGKITDESFHSLKYKYVDHQRDIALRIIDHFKHLRHLDLAARIEAVDKYIRTPGSLPLAEVMPEVFPELWQTSAEREATPPSPIATAPETAPVFWAREKQVGDTPPDFIRRVYAPWLGKGLTRPDIKRLDPQLYVALSNWLRKNEMPNDLDLPTLKEANDRATKRLEAGDRSIVGEMTAKEAARLGAALGRRIVTQR
ncbi:MAG: hypothetical protein JHC96_10495 [Brevundimonas sp.]|uniref:hypothetical protein n=1 Tax=Brevundimonas sp. TaxID=1871086 RepID=UPI001A2CF9CD|nr:hypothetical protein [Brevundimonas sp.]MBJ7319217.1 hypothetical protein [Brevundimonas sp.]